MKHLPQKYSNGDTLKQLLARSRYLLFKNQSKWTVHQKERAELLFERYPDIEKAYQLTQKLSYIFENTNTKTIAMTRLSQWHEEFRKAKFKSFNTIYCTMMNHYRTILNYFDSRSTNASAEAFNAKIKAVRSQLRGVTNVGFFLYRLTRIYA